MSYDIRFRCRVLSYPSREGLSLSKVARILGISRQSVYNGSQRIEEKKSREKPATKINMSDLSEDVERYPDAYHYERAKRLKVSTSCVGYALKRLRVTYKKNAKARQGG